MADYNTTAETLPEETAQKLFNVLQIYPAADLLSAYERDLVATDRSQLPKEDQDNALGLLKILQCLN